ncbi:hypothetical protein ABIB38_003222 [Massilia sp. UYP11]|uniref:hypothetical protein n=1 Tax=Massilia sp. UYP11 TaxID=1756385 RepID=UPI003D1984C3
MRIRHIALLAAAALAAIPAFAAALAAAPAAAEGAAAGTQAVQEKKAWLDPLMSKRMQGVYRLDDGRTLHVSERRRKLYADLGAGPVEIVHTGGDRFEAVGGDLRLNFEGGPFPYAVVLETGPDRRVASSGR